jgi:hypothetical protein
MPSIIKRVANKIQQERETKNKPTGNKTTELKNKLATLKTRAQNNIQKDKAYAAKVAIPQSRKVISKTMINLSKKAAKQVPMSVSRQIEFDMESLPFNSERMSTPTINDIEIVTGIKRGTASDPTLKNLENATLYPHKKKKNDWQNTFTEL